MEVFGSGVPLEAITTPLVVSVPVPGPPDTLLEQESDKNMENSKNSVTVSVLIFSFLSHDL